MEEKEAIVPQIQGSLWGRTLRITIPRDPSFGQVTDLETGADLSSVCRITFDLDMNRRNWRNRIKASLTAVRPASEKTRFLEEVPVAIVKEFTLIVQMATYPLMEEWDRFQRVQQEIMETIDKIGTIDDTDTQEEEEE